MKEHKNLFFGILVVAVGIAAFFGGNAYGKQAAMKTSTRTGQFGGAQRNFGNGTIGGPRGGMGGFVGGEIIAKDDKSITVKLTNGGSKIVFYTDKTNVLNTVSGTTNDLAIGKEVTINGSANSDGSVNAESVQVRPAPATTPPSTQTQ